MYQRGIDALFCPKLWFIRIIRWIGYIIIIGLTLWGIAHAEPYKVAVQAEQMPNFANQNDSMWIDTDSVRSFKITDTIIVVPKSTYHFNTVKIQHNYKITWRDDSGYWSFWNNGKLIDSISTEDALLGLKELAKKGKK